MIAMSATKRSIQGDDNNLAIVFTRYLPCRMALLAFSPEMSRLAAGAMPMRVPKLFPK